MTLVSSNMGLTLWNGAGDNYSHTQLQQNFQNIDTHDHSPTKGVQVGTAGIATNAITAQKIDGSLKPSVSAAAGTEALRALGAGANNAMAGNDSRVTTPTYINGAYASRPAAGNVGRTYYASDIGVLFIDTGVSWIPQAASSGATNISAAEARSNTAYGTLTTPDSVQVFLPTNGQLEISYQATWQESIAGAARAAIFIGGTQLKVAYSQSSSTSVITGIQEGGTSGGQANKNWPLMSFGQGLVSLNSTTAYTGDVTTGQALGIVQQISVPNPTFFIAGDGQALTPVAETAVGGPCRVFAASGLYTVTIQYKASSGSVTASNRKLWVRAIAFGS